MTTFGIVVAVVLLLWVSLLYVPFRWRPVGIFLFVPKVVALGYVPFVAAFGVVLAGTGVLVGAWWMAVLAAIAVAAAMAVMVRVGAVSTDLAGALGSGWEERIPADLRASMVSRWWRGRLPRSPEPRLRRDVPFATVPGTDRALVCDVWQPPMDVPASGVAVVYLHGSAYYFLDKDLGTRPLFRHLAAQGHVVVDVAHRLFPETDVPGMVADAKRAVAWVRSHCAELDIDADRIVLVGASSGGHLALLAAYTHDDPALTPAELRASDPRVCAVASLYGQVSLEAMYEHAGQDKLCHPDDPQPDWTAPPSPALVRLFGDNATRLRLAVMTYAGRCDWLLGGTPTGVAERYREVSVLQHISGDVPPTLLMHGTHDEMAPITPVRDLAERLQQAGAPVSAVYLPHTDHMFDLAGTVWSPAARVAVYTLERFLAVIAHTEKPAEKPGSAATRHAGDAGHDKPSPASKAGL